MNSREQFLLKRIRELELRLALTMQELQRVATDRDYTESVGCAFAWDMAQLHDHGAEKSAFRAGVERVLGTAAAQWDEAVKATEKMLDEAQGIRRAADGSIISILPVRNAK